MTITQIVLVAIFAAICGASSIIDQFEIYQPLVACTVMGLILGDVTLGVMLGAQLQVIVIGWMNIGAAVAPDPALASLIASILVVYYKEPIAVGFAIAIPLAVAGQMIGIFARTLSVGFQHLADSYANKGNLWGIDFCNWAALTLQMLRVVIPVLVVALVSADAVRVMLSYIPPVVSGGLEVAGGFIVVVGYAMVIQMMEAKYLMQFFFLGFVIAVFSKFNLVGLGIIGTVLAIIYLQLNPKYNKKETVAGSAAADDDLDALLDEDDDFESELPPVAASMATPEPVSVAPTYQGAVESLSSTEKLKLTKADLINIWIRSIFLQASWNYERMQALGWCFVMVPAIRRLYPEKEARSSAMKRHLVFFNTTPFTANPIMGIVIAMEEEKANGADIDDKAINAVKVGLMGPFAGVGDPIFWGTLRPIFATVGAGIALNGNILGVFIFFFGWNIVTLAFRWYSIKYGYEKGVDVIQDMGGNKLQKLTEGASILGLFVMGALVAMWTHIYVPLAITKVTNPITHKVTITTVQSILDRLLPGLLSLILTLVIIQLLKKKVSPILLIFGLFGLGILGFWLGFLGLPPK